MHVLITGMSGTGKSALVGELRSRGYAAYDADDDGFTEPRDHGRWGWRVDLVQDLLSSCTSGPLFFAGCSEEQAGFDFDVQVLLVVPEDVITDRILARSSNSYGRGPGELEQILSDVRQIEPLLRRRAHLVLDTTPPIQVVADLVLRHVSGHTKA